MLKLMSMKIFSNFTLKIFVNLSLCICWTQAILLVLLCTGINCIIFFNLKKCAKIIFYWQFSSAKHALSNLAKQFSRYKMASDFMMYIVQLMHSWSKEYILTLLHLERSKLEFSPF